MTVQIYDRHINDTNTPMTVELKRRDAEGELQPEDLTGKNVFFKMVDYEGTVIVEETNSGVTVTDAVNGRVEFDFRDADVDEAGTFYGYFVVYTGSEFDTFPVERRDLKIIIHND